MQISVTDKDTNKVTTIEAADKTLKAVGAFYAAAQLKKHLKDNGKADSFEVKIPGTGRRKLSEGEKWANKFAKLSPKAQAEVQDSLATIVPGPE